MPLAVAPTGLQVTWFLLIAVLWTGYLVLEGFDYGVAMLIPILGRNEKERRTIVNTIGPVWDGNQVWLLTAGGATFAAFPAWYATLFSGLYLPLFLILMGLIVRGVAFEYRAKRPETEWRHAFDRMSSIGSLAVAFLFGVAFGNFIIGLPVEMAEANPSLHVVTRGLFGLLNPFALLTGVCLVALFLFHGANYLALKSKGEMRDRARAFSLKAGLVSIVLGAVFLLWSNIAYGTGAIGWVLLVLAAASLVVSLLAGRAGRDGIAFVGTVAAIVFVAVGVFARMWPSLGFDNTAVPDSPLDVTTAASSELTLTIMAVAAGIFVPIVLAYTAWSYWVNRRRIGVENIPDEQLEPEAAPSY
ncbi:cytochrome d ubiquinol oxidase subunit II [Nigerium massiliense]|uniref:cytochrome d ubiquinol oxidase subunit II n=1 Tax=Nigerium massiliense TaxID=1522317 RepID=UPI000693B1D0|nr:cytochrome d ubiquinol oxidase subunit II [Nigerium massiliense]